MNEQGRTILRLRREMGDLRDELEVARAWSARWKASCKAEYDVWSEAIEMARKFSRDDL